MGRWQNLLLKALSFRAQPQTQKKEKILITSFFFWLSRLLEIIRLNHLINPHLVKIFPLWLNYIQADLFKLLAKFMIIPA
jgi:hypothetical protein